MPAIVNDGSVRILKLMKDHLTFWFAVGKTSSWPDDDNPPQESVQTALIDDIQGLKKVDTINFVKEDSNGTIVFGDKKYSVVNEQDIYDQDAIYMYFSATLKFEEFPIVTFRQTALLVDVIPKAGHESDDPLLPENVNSYGKMIAYVNHVPKVRVGYGKDLIEFLIKLEGQITT